jgi:ribosomal protein RSM22 (predicted rRNA methylase)
MYLPEDLRAGLDDMLSSVRPKDVSSAREGLTRRYRDTGPKEGSYVRSAGDVAAYAAARLPATYAAMRSALGQVRGVIPAFQPQSLLDAGAGPGTVMWAAQDTWPDLVAVTLLERDPDMAAFGSSLAGYAASPALRGARWQQTDLARSFEAAASDLVTAAYVLGELPEAARDTLVQRLWEQTQGVLVLLEPGTPEGFARILRARTYLLSAGAHIAAPCPHSDVCPLGKEDWCHFSQRLERSRLHRLAKSGELSYEDEKFSFIAATRLAPLPVAGRVIRHPQLRGGHIRLEVCSPRGIESTLVTRKEGEHFRRAKGLRWGSPLPDRDPGGEHG